MSICVSCKHIQFSFFIFDKKLISLTAVFVKFNLSIFAKFFKGEISSKFTLYNKCNSHNLIKHTKAGITDVCKEYDVGFYYKNPDNMEILCYNSSKKYDPASTNKTYLALCVFKMIKDGKIDINEILGYKEQHRYGGTGQIKCGTVGDKYSIEQPLELLITQGDNI